ncbi:hypothetical protein Psal006b_00982 [Piscirickettsia salmonis]|uniref:Uncharacterized protein n=1 Tax=Piscirickettsia salmonis TaxID=1238 RepID=A0A1L6TDB2_PISSA|nr:hypothetical protein [Piscirickettsia salmonis]AKP74434.1 hypothetical protein PSLF89_2877 [Piscirickettsia salmonis LF-89 = ATCC VR-1361]ALB23401.1 hypothetical protein KU39_2221 [Piscirickettsia salmonis]ALY03288.1 hypothetical protein AWE47_10890 [Piscirickettsia salmonis]AMA42855.1 hypothetical protein AWJ11_11115 [Piscirickettsia salmonis]AOS35322.1 hypothetical protein AVM72_08245 [Piscirickettsia salmonis]
MKFGKIKEFLKEGNLLSVDAQLLQELGNRYIHKHQSWWKTLDKNDESLAHELINFKNRPESRRPESSDQEGQSIECCYKLLDVLKGVGASPGYPEDNWLASKIVDILNTVFTKEPHNKVKLRDYSIDAVINHFKSEIDRYASQTVSTGYIADNTPAINNSIDKQVKQQLEKERLIANFLKNTSVKSGGEEVYFNNQSYRVPKGVLEAFRSSNQLLEPYNSNRRIVEIDNRLPPKDLKAMISYFMKSYAKENNASQQRFHIGGWGKRSEETMVMYQHFKNDKPEGLSKYFENMV